MNQVDMNVVKKIAVKEKIQRHKKSPQKNEHNKMHGGEEFIKKAILIKQLAPDKELSDFSGVLSSPDKISVKCSRY